MELTKDKVKRSAIVAGVVGAATEYLSASVINSFDLIKNYKFQQFWNSIDHNLMHPIANISNVLSNDMYTQIQPLLIGGTLFLAGKVLFEKIEKYDDASDYGAYGTARWAKDSEIFDTSNISGDIKAIGTILGTHKGKPIIQHTHSYLNRNVIGVGAAGAGKTRGLIIPNILHNMKKSMVVIDPKGELYEQTSQIKREQGFEVHLVNFKDRDKSDRYNLFDYIRRDSDAFKIADTMVSNAGEGMKVKKDFWNQKQIAVLQAIKLYVKYALPKEQQHMGSVHAISGLSEEQLKALFEQFPKGHIVHNAYQTAIEQLKEKTFGDVFATMTNTLNPWLYDDVCEFTAANDFHFEDLGKKKMIVYVIMPIADNEFRPLITTFFTQMFSELYRLADQNYGVLPQGVILALDEFANIGKIPDFETRLSTCRGLGIEVTIILQDTSQLENRYGKDLAKEIINNCDMRILLKANDPETAKYFSRLAGKTTIKIKNKSNSSGNKSSSKSESVQYTGRDLITEQEVMKLPFDYELLFISGQYPMKVKKAWFDKIKQFKNMSGKKVSRDDYPVPERGEYQAFTYKKPISLEKEEFEEDLFIPKQQEEDVEEESLILEDLDKQPKQKDDDDPFRDFDF